MKDKVFGVLQRVGRSFMLPIAILPVAGLFLGIGGSFTNAAMIETYGLTKILGEGTFLYGLLMVLNRCGDIVFANLPILFAMGVAIGMAKKEKEVAALSGAIAFFVMHAAISAMIGVNGLGAKLPNGSIAQVVGIESLQMGVFGGIIVGLGVAALHNRFYRIRLPQVLSFFGGTRFVPIISSVVYLIVGVVMAYVWPYIQNAIYALGDLVRNSGYFGTWIYGTIERALIPFGLHHVFYLPFWQTGVGGVAEIGGELVEGAQNIFFAELASGTITKFNVEATRFMTGKFPFMMFGLPAAALAMYRCARPEKRKIAGGLLLSAALTSFVTGITEPLEFTFLFVAPLLYAVHCVLAGLSFMLIHYFRVTVGMTFSGGLIDLVLFGVLQGNSKTNWIWVIPVGILYFSIYYVIFSFMIRKFDYQTPGREEGEKEIKLYTRSDYNEKKAGEVGTTGQVRPGQRDIDTETSALIVAGLGGKDNITDIDCCATRLRCSVVDGDLVEEGKLKASGAAGVIKSGNGVQIIFGPRVSVIKSHLEEYLENGGMEEVNLHTKQRLDDVTRIYCPIKGTVAPVTEAPDAGFAQKMMGDGVVITPKDHVVYAPCDGKIGFVFPTNHAVGFVTDSGLELLLHVGIDTVKLEGKGFTILVKEGQRVKKGDKIMEFDVHFIAKNAKSIATPLVISNLNHQTVELVKLGESNEKELIMEIKENA